MRSATRPIPTLTSKVSMKAAVPLRPVPSTTISSASPTRSLLEEIFAEKERARVDRRSQPTDIPYRDKRLIWRSTEDVAPAFTRQHLDLQHIPLEHIDSPLQPSSPPLIEQVQMPVVTCTRFPCCIRYSSEVTLLVNVRQTPYPRHPLSNNEIIDPT